MQYYITWSIHDMKKSEEKRTLAMHNPLPVYLDTQSGQTIPKIAPQTTFEHPDM